MLKAKVVLDFFFTGFAGSFLSQKEEDTRRGTRARSGEPGLGPRAGLVRTMDSGKGGSQGAQPRPGIPRGMGNSSTALRSDPATSKTPVSLALGEGGRRSGWGGPQRRGAHGAQRFQGPQETWGDARPIGNDREKPETITKASERQRKALRLVGNSRR